MSDLEKYITPQSIFFQEEVKNPILSHGERLQNQTALWPQALEIT